MANRLFVRCMYVCRDCAISRERRSDISLSRFSRCVDAKSELELGTLHCVCHALSHGNADGNALRVSRHLELLNGRPLRRPFVGAVYVVKLWAFCD